MKLNEIGFSMEYFTADFSRFSSTNVETCYLGEWPSDLIISEIFLQFPKVFSCLAIREVTRVHSHISSTNVKICFSGGQLETRHQIQAFQGLP